MTETSKTKPKVSSFNQLRGKQQCFVIEYLKDRNATRAYIRAGYQCTYESAMVNGCKLLRNTKIIEAIREKDEEFWKDKEKERGKVLRGLLELAEADLRDFVEEKDGKLTLKSLDDIESRALKSLSVNRVEKHGDKVNEKSESFKISIHDKVSAYEKIAKILGMMNDKVVHEGPNGGPIIFEMHKDTKKVADSW